ncbi:MAG: NAD(P)H-dependent oxidoreductase [Ilumatobacter sp.]|jgi:NAD(P)H dehydrogenase (quinone)|uniref:NAD(P)H-dependent oxidoreductase n=1 Tax=Ilumatobacter sp. TaxID=1967498 RepID=UPI00391DB2CE
MHVALVVTHPNVDSYTHELARRAGAGLRAAGHEVTDIDLYAEGFRAAMTPAERAAYHSDEPIVDDQVRRYADLVTSVDMLVFVYPTWWSGLPAVLKGWLDRVLVPGIGFRFDDKSGKVRPGLGNIRRIVGISTYGSPRWYVRLINDNGRRSLTRTLRLSCGPRTRTTWLGHYAIDSADDAGRLEFAAHVEATMAGVR